jgi:hypothetical protein
MNRRRLVLFNGAVFFGLCFIAILLLLLSGPLETALAAGPWYVAPGGDDGNSCQSPSAPCETINGAIGKASGGDTIYVALGTYTPLGDGWMGIEKDITLSGGWDGTFTTQDGTSTIDGEGAGNRIGVGSNVTVLIDRFTMQNDAGINNYGVLTLTNNILRDNTSAVGGGIWAAENTSTTVIDSQIYGNEAEEDGGGIHIFNYCDLNSDLTLIRSWVVGNAVTDGGGGGIKIDECGSATIENSIIAGNYASGDGGGIRVRGSGPYQIINSNIIGNLSDDSGSAIVVRSAEIVATNTLIIGNTGETGITDPWGYSSVITLNYCDTYGNGPDGTVGVIITRNNCLGTPQEYGLDPMMAGGPLPSGTGPDYADEWMDYDYRLLPGSPAIDAGTPTGAPADDIEGNPRDATPDMGAYEYPTPKTIYLPLVVR